MSPKAIAVFLAACGVIACPVHSALADAPPPGLGAPPVSSVTEVRLSFRIDAPEESLAQLRPQVEAIVRKRLDPDGSLGVIFTVREDRLEVRVPTNAAAKKMRDEHARLREDLRSHGIVPEQVQAICGFAETQLKEIATLGEKKLAELISRHPAQEQAIRAMIASEAELRRTYRVAHSERDIVDCLSHRGIVEFRAAEEVANLPDAENLRKALPRTGETRLEGRLWLPVKDPLQWLTSEERENAGNFLSNPAPLFQRRGHIACAWKDRVWMLVSDRPESALGQADSPLTVWETEVQFDSTGMPSVVVRLDEPSSATFGKYTDRLVGQSLAVIVDGEVVTCPRLRSALSSLYMITGLDTYARAKTLAAAIEHPLPVQLRLVGGGDSQ